VAKKREKGKAGGYRDDVSDGLHDCCARFAGPEEVEAFEILERRARFGARCQGLEEAFAEPAVVEQDGVHVCEGCGNGGDVFVCASLHVHALEDDALDRWEGGEYVCKVGEPECDRERGVADDAERFRFGEGRGGKGVDCELGEDVVDTELLDVRGDDFDELFELWGVSCHHRSQHLLINFKVSTKTCQCLCDIDKHHHLCVSDLAPCFRLFCCHPGRACRGFGRCSLSLGRRARGTGRRTTFRSGLL
jgi:hypothetical protein